MVDQSHVPKLHQLNNDYEKLLEENKKLQEGSQPNRSDNPLFDEELKNQLGEKYEELGDMVNILKDNLLRVAQ